MSLLKPWNKRKEKKSKEKKKRVNGLFSYFPFVRTEYGVGTLAPRKIIAE